MKIAKALKVKNRLVEKLNKAWGDFHAVNSRRIEEDTPTSDPSVLWENVQKLTAQLWRLKAAIAKANEPIQDAIFEVAELKGMITQSTRLNTDSGKQVINHYNRVIGDDESKVVENVAYLNKVQLDVFVEGWKNRIDELTDQMEYFNAITEIDVKGILE